MKVASEGWQFPLLRLLRRNGFQALRDLKFWECENSQRRDG